MISLTEQNIDSLNEEQLRTMLKIQLARYDLIVRHNKLTLFRYDIPSGTMYIQTLMDDGSTPRFEFPNYFKYVPGQILDESEHARVVEMLKRLCNDKETPLSGAIGLTYVDGRRVSCEYTCVLDSDGNKMAVVGQHVDMYRTHDRLLSTIDTLSEHKQLADALFGSFDTIVLINFDTMSHKLLKATNAVRAVNGQVDSFRKLSELYCNFYVTKEDQPLFMSFVDADNIQQRLLNAKSISCNYNTTNIGPCHARIIPVKVQANGFVSQVIFASEAVMADGRSVAGEETSMDSLTGLLSPKSGAETITQALNMPSRGLFLYIDIDFFRAINSMLGQPIGDMLLIEVAKQLSDAFPSDIIMRNGNDEFVLYITNPSILAQLDTLGPDACFQKLQKRISGIAIPEMNGIVPSVSAASISVEPNEAPTFEQLLANAKAKIVWTKQKGGVLAHEE